MTEKKRVQFVCLDDQNKLHWLFFLNRESEWELGGGGVIDEIVTSPAGLINSLYKNGKP